MMTKYIVMRCNDQMHYYWLYVYAARIKKKDMGRTMWEYCKCWMMDKEVKHFLVNFVSHSFTSKNEELRKRVMVAPSGFQTLGVNAPSPHLT